MAEIKVTADTSQAERALASLTSALGALSSIVIGGSIADQFIKITSAAQEMTNKLIFATGSLDNANKAFDLLATTAKATGSNLGGTVDLFQKLSQSSTLAGSSQEALSLITSNFNKTLQISGASGAGAASALYQFAQAMQKGTLNGDEFRTISETNGYLLKVLEKQTGKTASELRQMATDGKLSAEIIARALTDATKISEDYGKTIRTIPQAFENLNTSVTQAVKNFNDFTGIGNLIVTILNGMSNNIGVVIGALAGLAVGIAALLIPLIPAATAMAVLTGGAAVAGAIAVGAALGLAAQQAGVFGQKTEESNQSQAETNRLAAAGLKITHQRNQEALKIDQSLRDEIGKLKVTNDLQAQSTGLVSLQLEIEKQVGLYREKYKKTGEAITPELEKQFALEVRRKVLLGEQQKVNQEILKIKSSTSTLAITDIAQEQLINQLEALRLSLTKETFEARKNELETTIRQNIQAAANKNIAEEIRNVTQQNSLLTIEDLRQRGIEAEILNKKNQLGSAFTTILEDQYRKTLQIADANKKIDELRQKNISQVKGLGIGAEIEALKLYRAQDTTGGQGYGETLNKGNLDRAAKGFIAQGDRQLAIQIDYSKKINDLDLIQTQLKIAELDKEFDYQKQITDAKKQLQLDFNYSMNQLESQKFQEFSKYKDLEIQREAEVYAEKLRMQTDFLGKTRFSNESIKQIATDRAAFEKKTDLEKAQFAIDQGAQMYTALGSQNKKAFEAAKAFNIANAIINTYMAATKALATYPPPFSFIAAAAAVGMGLAQVAQIRAQSYSGKALGGPVMGGQPYLVGESGPEIFTPNTTGNITRNSDIGGGGPTNVNFTIVANDAQGFDDLLLQRRGMITQMISDAMLERGSRSMV